MLSFNTNMRILENETSMSKEVYVGFDMRETRGKNVSSDEFVCDEQSRDKKKNTTLILMLMVTLINPVKETLSSSPKVLL